MSAAYPLDRLTVELGVTVGPPTDDGRQPVGWAALANVLGCGRDDVRNWSRRGVPADQVERLAGIVGLEPEHIWPAWLDDPLADSWLGELDEGQPGYFTDDPSLDELEHDSRSSAA